MTATPDEHEDLQATLDRARAYGHNLGRLRYAGITPDPERGAMTVFRVPDAAFDAAIHALAGPDVVVDLVDAPHTRDELLVAREHVWALADTLPITSISLPPDGTCLTVHADAPADEVQAALDRVVPGLAVAVASEQPRADAPL